MAKKEGLNSKQMAVLLKENTIASQEMTDFVVELYEQFLGTASARRIEGGDSAQFDWSAIALRQTHSG
jgi:hypothetical protein